MTTSDFRHQPERALEQIRETTDSGPAIGIELARTALASQPFSVLLGCRLAEFSRGGVALELDVREELRQHHG